MSTEMEKSTLPLAGKPRERYRVKVDEYTFYHANGYLKVEGLLDLQDVDRLAKWADDLLDGREAVPGLGDLAPDAAQAERFNRITRIHQLHRVNATAEWGLLLPPVLDVLEALIGPDVLALQSMLFFNPPGRGGQGWHQDAYYIPTFPDTLIGAWIALEPADEENGCLWVVPGSRAEPIYPPEGTKSSVHALGAFNDLHSVENVSHLDDSVNTLSKVVGKYPPHVPVPMQPGDVLFFHAHLLHRSYPNRSVDRLRRSYVCHYCNARSFVPWNHGEPYEGDCANGHHILARGRTHMAYAAPAFGTVVDLPTPGESSTVAGARMMGMEDGQMMAVSTPRISSFRAPGSED